MFEPTYLPESGGSRYLRATRLIKYHTKIYDQAARQRPKRRAVKRLGRVAEGWLNWVEANKQDILYHKDNVKEKPCHIVR